MTEYDPDDDSSDVECAWDGCDKPFPTERGMKSHHVQKHGVSIAGVRVNCAWCGEEKRTPRHRAEALENHFCGDECEGKWRERHQTGEKAPAWKGGKVTVECAVCGAEKEVWPAVDRERERYYCSEDCLAQWNTEHLTGRDNPLWKESVTVECAWCGKPKEVVPAVSQRSERHFCNHSCFGEWRSEYAAGQNSHAWKGGSPSYYGPTWRRKRRKVLERDEYECVVCGEGPDELGRNPDVHHIVPVRCFGEKESAHQLGNLITLCRDHHNDAEYGRIEPPTPQSPLTPQIG